MNVASISILILVLTLALLACLRIQRARRRPPGECDSTCDGCSLKESCKK